MAKTLIEELEALVGKDGLAKIQANQDVLSKLTRGDEYRRLYDGDDTEDAAAIAKAASDKAAADKAESDRLAAERARTVAASSTTDLTKVLTELQTLTKTINELNEFKKTAITLDKLPGYESTLLRKSHEIARIEANHAKEFNEDWDLNKFDEWVGEQKKTGAGWPSITAAYNAWVQDKRIEARVKKEVDEQVKLKVSAQTVPAQTTTTSLSPAQQIISDAKKTNGDGTGKTNAMKAAERLAAMERAREGHAA
jgi:hypothetical protein